MSGPRGIQLSGTQIIASVLATLTGAIAASYLGVAGTLVGAAIGSVACTMGTEVYKHYLQRSQERLRSAGQVIYHSTARTNTGNTMGQAGAESTSGGRRVASSGTASRRGADRDLADRETAVWDRRQYGTPRDPHQTQMIPGQATQWGGTTSGGSPNGGAFNGGAPNGESGPGDMARQHAHGDFTEEGPTAGRGSVWAAITSFFGSLTRRQWLTYGGIAAGIFLIVVAGITIFELTVGKPVGQLVYGRSSTHSGPSSPRQSSTHPASTPSATPTTSTSATPTSSAGTTSGTPTPGISGASSSPSTVPSPTPSTGSSGPSGSSTTAPPIP